MKMSDVINHQSLQERSNCSSLVLCLLAFQESNSKFQCRNTIRNTISSKILEAMVEEMASTGPCLRRRRLIKTYVTVARKVYWPDFDTALISSSFRFEWRPSCLFACADRPGSNTCQNSNDERQTNRKITWFCARIIPQGSTDVQKSRH